MSTERSSAALDGVRRGNRSRARWGARIAWCAAAAVLAAARQAAAQAADPAPVTAEAAASGHACYHPRPSPACRSYWVTEFGGAWYEVQPRGSPDDRKFMFAWELGWMRNRSAREAVGGSLFFATNDQAMRGGVRARYRRWLADGLAVDVAPGLIVFQANDDYVVRTRPGASVLGGVSFGDVIGLTGEVESTGGGVRMLYGVRVGSYAGAATGLALPVFIAALLGDDS